MRFYKSKNKFEEIKVYILQICIMNLNFVMNIYVTFALTPNSTFIEAHLNVHIHIYIKVN